MSEKIKVKEVWLRRAEGRVSECVAVTLPSLDEANKTLARWSHTAPGAGGGYHKCDFMVTWENGETYEGRFDLQHMGEAGYPSIERQMARYMRFIIGEWRPPHTTQDQYETYLSEVHSKVDRASVRQNLATLEGLS